MAEEKPEGEIPQQVEKSKPRFRLKFPQGLELGRSQFSVPRLPGFHKSTVTSKFYSSKDVSELQEDEEEKFIDSIAETERIHFPKRTSDMVKVENLLDNAAKAEELYQKVKSNK